MSMFPHALAPVTAESDGGDLAGVTDLAEFRARHRIREAEEAEGRLLFLQLRAEARAHRRRAHPVSARPTPPDRPRVAARRCQCWGWADDHKEVRLVRNHVRLAGHVPVTP